MIIAQMSPMTQVRRVLIGIEVSSVFATAERTSGYGESSSGQRVVYQLMRHEQAGEMSMRTKEFGILVDVRIVKVSNIDDMA